MPKFDPEKPLRFRAHPDREVEIFTSLRNAPGPGYSDKSKMIFRWREDRYKPWNIIIRRENGRVLDYGDHDDDIINAPAINERWVTWTVDGDGDVGCFLSLSKPLLSVGDRDFDKTVMKIERITYEATF